MVEYVLISKDRGSPTFQVGNLLDAWHRGLAPRLAEWTARGREPCQCLRWTV